MVTTPKGNCMRGQRLVWSGVFVVATAAALAAQTAQQRPTFRSGIDLIEVDVSVIDGDSVPISDLQPSDFSVTVDGEPRRVLQAHFDLLAKPERDAAQPAPATEDVFHTSNADAERGRLVVIAVDQESILFGEGRHVMQAASEFIKKLSPGDRVSVVAVPQPGAFVDFTLDHDHASRAIAGMSGRGRRRVGVLNIGVSEAFRIFEHNDISVRETVVGRVCSNPDGTVAANPGPGALAGQAFDAFNCQQRVEFESRQIVQESRLHSENMRYGLEEVLKALREVEGPKVLLWISGGHVVDGTEMTMRSLENLVVEARTTLYVMMVDEPLGGDISQAASEPSARDDRRMREEGLHLAAAITRGTVFRAHFNPDPIFDRLESEMSGYYLLGVESRPHDRDKERRKIEVSVRREGARVRARREISFTPEDADKTVEARVASMLRSPIPIKELPLRVATYAYRETDSAPVRVLVAAEVDVQTGDPSGLTLGYALRDQDGTVVSGGQTQITPRVVPTLFGPVFETTFTVTAEPGTYSLRLAVVDPAGRRGSIEHPVHAETPSSGPLTVGDLMVADPSASPQGERLPPVQARVSSGHLLAYTELLADSSELWQDLDVYIDVADDATGPGRAGATMSLQETKDPLRRVVAADLTVTHLPPGPYVARLLVMQDSVELARLHRPFQITVVPRQ
jgi:VWFA-related protein